MMMMFFMCVLYQEEGGMSSLFYQKILVVATVHGELLSLKLSVEGDRRGMVTNYDVLHSVYCSRKRVGCQALGREKFRNLANDDKDDTDATHGNEGVEEDEEAFEGRYCLVLHAYIIPHSRPMSRGMPVFF